MIWHGKIKVCMQTSKKFKNEPPKLVPSLVAGFNLVANNLQFLILPILLDIFIWFGPILRVQNLLAPIFSRAVENMKDIYSTEQMAVLTESQLLWNELIKDINLFVGLRTFPVGVPSLMISNSANIHPLGTKLAVEVPSFALLLLILIMIVVIGIFLGTVLFQNIEKKVSVKENNESKANLIFNIEQSGLLTLVFFLLIVFIMIPILCFLSSVAIFLPSLGSIPFLALGLVLIWLLTPLVFTPHGIFLKKLKLFHSMSLSAQLVRSFLPNTGSFLLIAFLLSYGLDIIWSLPETSSWLMVVGIIGHAFISTAIISATFIFYYDGLQWMQEVLSKRSSKSEDLPA